MEYPAVMSLRQSQLAGQTLTARRRAKQSVNPCAKKYSPLPNFGYIVSSVHPSPPQGAFRDRHETRAGVRWPRRRRRAKSRLWGGNPSMVLREQRQARYDTALTASRFGFDGERTPAVEDCERGCARTEKSCGPDARGLCVKSCGDVAAQPGTRISHLHGDGGNSASLPGESTKDTVKTIRAGKAGMFRRHPSSARARLIRTRDFGCQPAPGLPCALLSRGGQEGSARLGRKLPRECEHVSAIGVSVERGAPLPTLRHCERSGAIQNPSAERLWIASRSLSSGRAMRRPVGSQ